MRGDQKFTYEFPEGTIWLLLEKYGWDLPSPRTGWQTVKCHAHKDSHASCRLNHDLNAAKCQACDFHGDLIKIVRFYEGSTLSFREAVNIIESLTNTTTRTTGRYTPYGARKTTDDKAYVPPRLRGSHA